LALASALGIAFLGARMIYTYSLRHGYLAWNLFLAWLPVWFALALWRRHERDAIRSWRFAALACLWLLFLPNAPYLLTDLKHLKFFGTPWFWVDLVLILWFAWIGMLLGFLALHVLHALVRERWGWLAGWGVTVGAAGLSGLGISLGRFSRRNSWDAALNPFQTAADLLQLLTSPRAMAISLLFGLFLLITYITLHALIQLGSATGEAAGSSRAVSHEG
jgi:uncharacterized membrane protein